MEFDISYAQLYIILIDFKNGDFNTIMKDERPIAENIDKIDAFFSSSYFFAGNLIKKNEIVLDSGCGSGYGTYYLSTITRNLVFGVDYEKKIIEDNKNKYHKENLHFVVNNGKNIAFKNDFFDKIVSFEVIEHVDDYESYLLELKRVLKMGGTLIVATPNKEYFSPGLKKPIIVSHKKEFYSGEFSRLFSKYFKNFVLYGKILTPCGREKFNLINNSNRIKIKLTRLLARLQVIRKLAKYIPIQFRTKFSGGDKILYYNPKDIIIKKVNPEDFKNNIILGLVIVAKK